jgi:hypothetical protein
MYGPLNIELLEQIAQKLAKVPRPMDYNNFDPEFTMEEKYFLDVLRPVIQYVMFEDTERLKHRIRNHHHVVLSMDDGMKYRDNGMRINSPLDPEIKRTGPALNLLNKPLT